MEKKTLGRVIRGLLASGAMLGIIGFPMGATPAAGNAGAQAIQRTPNIQRTAIQREQFGTTEKQALQRNRIGDDSTVALNAWYDGAAFDKAPGLSLNVAFGGGYGRPEGAPTTSLAVAVAPSDKTPEKSLEVAGLIGHTIDGITPWILS